MKRQSNNGLETKQLAALAAGMLCPIPVLGEAVLAYGLNPIIKQTGLVKDNTPMNATFSLAVAGLTRLSFYGPFYLPMIHYASSLFQ
ncbi:MAG: hypothetical protein WC796_06430 [Candidatus Pacearchaeota archaeon]|jgi:hypothetical protein